MCKTLTWRTPAYTRCWFPRSAWRTNDRGAALRLVAPASPERYAFAMSRRLALAVAVAAAGLLALPASGAISDWSNGSKARMRVLAAGVGEDGKLSAAIEIILPKGWETYWRFPGDAGIAPSVD